jgi:hypothetical protein
VDKLTGLRKYSLALISLLASIGLCAFGRIEGGIFLSLVTVVLTLYKASNITDKRLNGNEGNG